MAHDRVEMLEDRLEAATFEITNLRRSVEAQNQIVADCRRDWRYFLDAVSRAVVNEPTPDHVAGVLADMLSSRTPGYGKAMT